MIGSTPDTVGNQAEGASVVVEDLWVGFHRGPVLRGVTCSFGAGEPWGLIGPSGSGKSVLLKTIAGIVAPISGAVTIETKQNGKVPLALMFQEGALFDSLSVFDNVAFPLIGGQVPLRRRAACFELFLRGRSTLASSKQAEIIDKVNSILARVGLEWAGAKMPAELSGGMRRRVSLARSLVVDPQILLLDDPTGGLDPVASSVIMELISEIQRESRTSMIIVSQDLRRLIPMVTNVVALFEGRVAARCRTDEIIKCDEQVQRFVSCRYDL